ncbi:uncharacterized protein LOC135097268 [Scylla paramamosain]|uniref:uncharacterized protein LOC135097268 n=1 Tax=Scylla paramamosain TaxID=85552 RepID=UPI003082906D
MDRGWCAGYMYQEQISTFFSIVATGMTYEMAMTSMPLQVLRLHLPHSPSSEAVVLLIFPKPQRYDTYVDGVFVPPANLNTSAAGYKLLPENPTHPQAFLPMLDNAEVASAHTTSLNGEEEEGAIGREVIPYKKLVQSLEKAVNRFQDGSCSNCASLSW